MKSKIFINQRDNDKFFKQKMPTWRNGFCEIVRNVTIEKDPHDIYLDCDLSTLINTLQAQGFKVKFDESYTNRQSKIRGYCSYQP